MIIVITIIHVIVSIGLILVVLLQQGKGADVGAVFGGSSSTVFGSSGAGGFLVQLTAALATIFFTTSIILAYASTKRVTGSIFEGSPRVPSHSAPAGKYGGPP